MAQPLSSSTFVGANLLFFESFFSSAPASVGASLFRVSPPSMLGCGSFSDSRLGCRPPKPLTELLALCVRWPLTEPLLPSAPIGVSGGVHKGRFPGIGPDCAAAILLTELIDGVACISTFESTSREGCTNDEATDDTDIERAGLAGLAGVNVDGEAGKLPSEGFLVTNGGAVVFTGVAFGVDWEEETPVFMLDGMGWLFVATGPW